MIPKLVHFCWFGVSKPNDLIMHCMGSWVRLLPDYKFLFWNEANCNFDFPYMKQAQVEKRWSKISNLVRLSALYKFGGIYLDSDVELLKSFDHLISQDCFLRYQLDEEMSKTDPCWVNNAVIGAEPRHEFVKACAIRTIREFETLNVFQVSSRVTSDVLREFGLKTVKQKKVGDVCLLSRDHFYPIHWSKQSEISGITSRTVAIHHWNFSWSDNI